MERAFEAICSKKKPIWEDHQYQDRQNQGITVFVFIKGTHTKVMLQAVSRITKQTSDTKTKREYFHVIFVFSNLARVLTTFKKCEKSSVEKTFC